MVERGRRPHPSPASFAATCGPQQRGVTVSPPPPPIGSLRPSQATTTLTHLGWFLDLGRRPGGLDTLLSHIQ